MTITSQTSPIICIAGPTASGKSSTAMAIARKHNGVIINADSMQVYQELRIITARPSVSDETASPHAMYGFISGAERYSTGRWAKDIRTELDRAKQNGTLPIIVGGTGLYFRALIEGLAVIPDVPETVSQYWRVQAQQMESHDLHKILSDKDPVMAQRLKPGDTQRISRALEVIDSTGQSLSYWQQQTDEPVLRPEEQDQLIKSVIAPPREQLYQRINGRFETMMHEGGLEEVTALQRLNLDPALPLMRALGVPELCAYINGACSKEEAIDKAQMLSRRYAKRQMTWLRGNMSSSDWTWFTEPPQGDLLSDFRKTTP